MSRQIPHMLKSGGVSLLAALLIGCGGDTSDGAGTDTPTPPGVVTSTQMSTAIPSCTPTATGSTPTATPAATSSAPQTPTATAAASCTPTETSAVSPTPTPTPAANVNVGVSGNSFTLNGTPWIPKAFNIAGFVSTSAYLQSIPSQAKFRGWVADSLCTEELFAAVKQWGADTVRIFVSQYYLDPSSIHGPYHDCTYFEQVVSIVGQARQAGLVVEIAMQDEEESGGPRFHGLPTTETLENWLALNQYFGRDQGVMYELYNEPNQGAPGSGPPSPAEWMLWLNGGTAYYPPGQTETFTAVGMQEILTALRNAGSVNTVVLDGLRLATTLTGVPAVNDPLERVGYGIHQYLQQGSVGPCDWESNFGNLSGQLPIFVDEWAACANTRPGLRGLHSYQLAVDFLNYLHEKKIGIGGWAINVQGYMFNDIPDPMTDPASCSTGWQQPSYYAGFPSSPIGDAGMLIVNEFLADYGRTLTLEDGKTLYGQPPPAYSPIACST